MKTIVFENRMSFAECEELNTKVAYNEDNTVNLAETIKSTGVEVVGTGRIGNDGHLTISENITNAELVLVRLDGKYANLWIAAESKENGFDDQVELHFVEES